MKTKSKPLNKMTKEELRREVRRLRRALKKSEHDAGLLWASKL